MERGTRFEVHLVYSDGAFLTSNTTTPFKLVRSKDCWSVRDLEDNTRWVFSTVEEAMEWITWNSDDVNDTV